MTEGVIVSRAVTSAIAVPVVLAPVRTNAVGQREGAELRRGEVPEEQYHRVAEPPRIVP
jgi:hypothetical protein